MANGVVLDERLRLVAQEVRPNAVFADVGCDHGRLAVYLAQKCGAQHGFACDIRPQPLEKARALIQKTGLEQRITPVLTDGLAGMEGRGITDVTIAGIGGEVLCDIIEKAAFLQKQGIRLVLQPMSREHLLRQTLYRLGFALLREQAVVAGHFVYTVMTAEYTGQRREIPLLFAYTGLLPEHKAAPSREKLLRTAHTMAEMAQGLLVAKGGEAEKENHRGKALLALSGEIVQLAEKIQLTEQ